jgi:hypothetical protein
VHWYEALLATFSILLWHFYMVIFDPVVYPMDLAWLTGKISADQYRHARPEYFRALKEAESQKLRAGEEAREAVEVAVRSTKLAPEPGAKAERNIDEKG